jgi:hypothetical protein
MCRTAFAVVSVVALGMVGAACTSTSGSTNTQPPSATGQTPQASTTSPTRSAVPVQSPVPVESNPPGDIPDNTQFVPYRSGGGHFTFRVPEGWSRRTAGASVSFTDKLNTVQVTWTSASAAPTVTSARANDVPMLRRTVLAFALSKIIGCAPGCTIPYSTAPISVALPLHAVVITYRANSQPNAVTGKQYRLEVLRFEFFKGGEEAALTLSGPVGSDNVDPWRLVSESFRWS